MGKLNRLGIVTSTVRKRIDYLKKADEEDSLILSNEIKSIIESLETSCQTFQNLSGKHSGVDPRTRDTAYHLSYLMGRITDLKVLIKRMGLKREAIKDLDRLELYLYKNSENKPGTPLSDDYQVVSRKNNELQSQMKQDMEYMYILGNQILDQIAFVSFRLLKRGSLPRNYDFHEFYKRLVGSKSNSKERILWKNLKRDIIWLHYQLRFYRNEFIEHLTKPWQRGFTHSISSDEFNFFIVVPAGYYPDGYLVNRVTGIFHLAPAWLKKSPKDYWERERYGRVLEITFMNIDNVRRQKDRERIWLVWKEFGGSTPAYEHLALRLAGFIRGYAETIESIAIPSKYD